MGNIKSRSSKGIRKSKAVSNPEPNAYTCMSVHEEEQKTKVNQQFIRALYDFQGRDEHELSFAKNDRMEYICDEGQFWRAKHLVTKKIGLVPSNYVMVDDGKPKGNEAWFEIGRREANRLLMYMGNPSGTYIIRPSSAGDDFALSIRYQPKSTDTWSVKHYKIRVTKSGEYFIKDNLKWAHITDLIKFYEETEQLCCKLAIPCPRYERPPVQFRDIEVNRSTIEYVKSVGQGQFGEVFMATWSNSISVAVKTLKPNTMNPGEFIEEAKLMHKMHHPRIVTLLGVCTKTEPIYIITEYMANGSLKEYLQKSDERDVSFNDIIDMMAQITEGMKYLEKEQFVHRDLRAANILVGEKKEVKVADFGLARLTDDSIYAGQQMSKFPVKWTAPEAMRAFRYTTKSDVWSFGIVMYEMVTMGGMPYPLMSNKEVHAKVPHGMRMPDPTKEYPRHCSTPLYETMLQCWQHEPTERPTFAHLNNVFEDWQASTEIQYQEDYLSQ